MEGKIVLFGESSNCPVLVCFGGVSALFCFGLGSLGLAVRVACQRSATMVVSAPIAVL